MLSMTEQQDDVLASHTLWVDDWVLFDFSADFLQNKKSTESIPQLWLRDEIIHLQPERADATMHLCQIIKTMRKTWC